MNKNDQIRVLHFAETLPGGIASYLGEIDAWQHERLGPNGVVYLVPENQRDFAPTGRSGGTLTFSYSRRGLLPLIALSMHFRRVVEDVRPDVVHLHSTFAGIAGRIGLIGAKCQPKVVYCPHGWSFCRQVPFYQKLTFSIIERLLGGITDATIHISEHERRAAEVWGIKGARHHTIYNGIADVAVSDPPRVPGVLNLIFLGRHDRQKGLDVALKAMKRITRTDAYLTVVGDAVIGVPVVNENMRNVRFLGWASRPKAQALIAESDVMIIPSRWEGFGLVAIEAMRAGKTVIASDAGALPEIVTPESGRIFTSEDHVSLANIIDELSIEDVRQSSDSIKSIFRDKFTSEKMNANIFALYNLVLERK